MKGLDVSSLDFEHCDEEKIHYPESIQAYGYLFAIDDDHIIRVISENVNTIMVADKVINKNFFDFLDESATGEFIMETVQRARAQETHLPLRITFKDYILTKKTERDFYAVIYNSDDLTVIEFEPAAKFRESYTARHYIKLYALSTAPRFKVKKGLNDLADEIVATVKAVTQMDRVLLYRFEEDNSGHVIAEAKNKQLDSYLDIRFPASDIPQQARELYTKSWIRLTANTELEPSPLYPPLSERGGKPLDLTHSVLRTLSPIHRQYIRNQGIKASMSMSLVTHGKLWGLILCHNKEPKYIPQNVRMEVENLAQLFSWHLYAKEEELRLNQRTLTDHAMNLLLDKLSAKRDLSVFKDEEREVLNILQADGFIFKSMNREIKLGEVPSEPCVQRIIESQNTWREPLMMHDIPKAITDCEGLGTLRGALIIFLSEQRDSYTAWFRSEQVKHEKWIGNSNEKHLAGSKEERLNPRQNFTINEVIVKDEGYPWSDYDVEIAKRFNNIFMNYSLEKQAQLTRDIERLEVQDKNKDEFMATLAHELRNPLSTVITGLHLLKTAPELMDDSITAAISRQVKNINNLVNDLSDVSRISEGKIDLREEQFPVREVIENALETTTFEIKQREHTVTTEIDEAHIKGDKSRLEQVFVNLLMNATKYTHKGGHIQIIASANNTKIEVSIKDNGMGIPEDEMDKIFEVFKQVDRHNKFKGAGLGLGLALVKRLVDLHNGSIKVHSEGADKGSTFTVTLPLA